MKDIAVGEDKQKWRKLPRRTARGFGEKGKASPEKSKYGERDDYFLGDYEADKIPHVKKKQIEQNIVPLARNGKPGNLMMFDQLREPGVVNMTAQVACLNA